MVTNHYISTAGSGLQLKKVGTEWHLFQNNGDIEAYDATGQLLRIIAKGGSTTTLAYQDGQLSTVTGPFGHQLRFQYDDSDRLEQVTDPAGLTILFAYDSSNNLFQVTYQDGSTRIYHYELTTFPNHLTGITDENGTRYASFDYDSSGRAISTEHAGGVNRYSLSYGASNSVVTDPLGTTHTYNFTTENQARRITGIAIGSRVTSYAVPGIVTDYQRRVTQKTDARGMITRFTYDRDHLLSKTEAYGTALARTTTYAYFSTDSDLPTLITEPGRTTQHSYDSAGNLLSRTMTDTASSSARTWSWTYDAHGRVLTEDGPRTDVSDVTTYTYYTCVTGNECGKLSSVTNALSQTTTYDTYNGHGQPTQLTDPNGVITTLAYDARGRLSSRSVVGTGETTTFEYWPNGQLKKVTQPDGSFLLHTYDLAHRLVSIEDGEGNRVEYTLDAMGNRITENAYDPSTALSRTRTQVFDSLNQLWKQIGSAGTAAVTTTFGYDNNGNETTIGAPLGRNTANQYDELNRLKQITDPGAGVAQFGYDANDNLTSVADPRGNVTTYTYNGFGDTTSVISPDTGTTLNAYDSGGNLQTTTDARGKVGTYSYDVLRRVTSISYPDLTTSFSYDSGTNAIGRLSGASDANHSLAFTYDTQGRVTSKSQTVDSLTKSVTYGYTNGNLTSLVTPSGQTITYGYSNGRIASVTLNLSTTILDDVLYEPFGPVAGWAWGNTTIAARIHDQDGNPTDIDSGGAYTYTYDDAFRITGITDLADGSKSWTYGYDNLDRLNAAGRTGFSQSFTYDANGNRLTEGGTATSTYTVSSSNNRLSGVSGALSRTYSYATSGQVTDDGSRTFTHSDAGRIKTVVSGGVTTTYVLNAFGQRVKKTNSLMTRYFVYDESGHLLGEYDGAGNIVAETVWLGDIPVATLRPNGAGVSVFYIHTDHLNTPRRISRSSDNMIVWRWDSDPFGTTAANEDPDGDSTTFVSNLRFPGQYFDAESGLSYNYFRDYDPYSGRYMQSDPIGLDGGFNTYTYVENDPIQWFDKSGSIRESNNRPAASPGACGVDGGAGSAEMFQLPPGSKGPIRDAACSKISDCYKKCQCKYDVSLGLCGPSPSCILKAKRSLEQCISGCD